jgi:hypothetical protein
MSTTLEEPLSRTHPLSNPAQRLRTQTAAARVSFNWFGSRKSLSGDQKAQAADAFGAEHDSLSASKRLLDAKHPAFKAVTAVKTRITSYWKGISLPFPEPGLRLIRQSQIDVFNNQMEELQQDLAETSRRLDDHYAELREAAREQLGSLYNPEDYPLSLRDSFGVSWDFPSVEPPNYLQQLSPDVYEQECQRAQARFDEAVQLAEAAFMEELHSLVEHLTERLSGQSDGKPMIFRDSAVENMTEFFERVRQLNVRSSDQLDELVDQCRDIVGGVAPKQLRDDTGLRTAVAADLAEVRQTLDELLVDRPRRNILRRPR